MINDPCCHFGKPNFNELEFVSELKVTEGENQVEELPELQPEEKDQVVEEAHPALDEDIADFDAAVADMLKRIEDIATKFLPSSNEAEVRITVGIRSC